MALEKAGLTLIAENAQVFFGDMNRASQSVNHFADQTDRAAGRTSNASEIMTGALRRVGELAVNAFMQAGRAVVGFVSDSISVAGDFEAGMNRFGAVAGDALAESGLSIKDFRDQFIQIGKELPVSTSEVQEAAIEMVKGGIDPATIAAGGLRQVIQFAAAADMDLASASTIAAKALGGWVDIAATAEEKAAFLTHSTDLLARAANASTVDVDDLALGLYNVQGTAKLAGVTFDETVTALAQLAPSFSSSADAGTSFKVFLSRLQPTTKPAIAAMQGLGLYTEEAGSAFYDASGSFVGMEQASALLKSSLEGLTDAQRQSVLQTIFGQDAIRVAAVLSDQGAEGYRNMATALAQQNSVAEMAAQKQAGFNTALDNFKGSVEALQITIGSYLLPVLTELFNTYLAPGINAVTSFAESIFSAQDPFLALTTAIDGVLPGFQTIITWFQETIPVAVAFLLEHMEAIKGALVAVGVVIAGAAVAGAIASLLNPITLVIAAVATLGAAWAEDWGGIRTALTQFWEETGRPIFDQVVAWLGENIPKAIQVVSDFWVNTLKPALQTVWDFLSTRVIPIIGVLVNTWFALLKKEIEVLANIWTNVLKPALDTVWSFLNTYIMPILSALANVAIAVLKKEIEVLAAIWTNVLKPALEDVWAFIQEHVIPIFEDAAGSTRDTLGPALSWLSDNVLGPLGDAFADIGRAIESVIGWVNDLAEKISSIEIPDWLEGHSPPPLADWFGFVAQEAERTVAAIGGLDRMLRGGRVAPAASAASIMQRGGIGSTTYNNSRSISMPIYTNQSPAVLQQSMAIVNAAAL